MLIQRQTGGNLAELLDKLSTLLRERAQFYGKVREGYLHLARSLPERFFVMDGEREPDDIELDIWNEMHARFFAED